MMNVSVRLVRCSLVPGEGPEEEKDQKEGEKKGRDRGCRGKGQPGGQQGEGADAAGEVAEEQE